MGEMGEGREKRNGGAGATQAQRPDTHARSHPRPAPLESNRHSLTPVKPMTDLVSHNPNQTQEYQNVSLFENQTVSHTPLRLRSSSAANSASILWADPGLVPLHLPEQLPPTHTPLPPRHTHTGSRQGSGIGPTQTLPRCPLQSLGSRL